MGALGRVGGRTAVAAIVVLVLVGGYFLVVRDTAEKRTVTAHFPRAVSIYAGSDVRILGVNVGRVTEVAPEGNSVRVEMEYDAQFQVPADAQAVIVTPTLVSDRFVQLTPAYESGDELMADGAEIELADTGVPVELDRIYSSLRDLSVALGPNGVNKDGTLDHVLAAGANALDGQGERGNRMLTDLARAAETFGEGAGPLFETVTQLARFATTLGRNDRLVRAFIRDLAGVTRQLSGERQEIRAALGSVARAVGTVKTFVGENRRALVADVEKLTRVMKTINSERDSIDEALRVAPTAIGNLALAFNNESGTIGSRIGLSGNVWDADAFLCAVVQQAGLPKAAADLACRLFEDLLEPIEDELPPVPPVLPGRTQAPTSPGGGAAGAKSSTPREYAGDTPGSLQSLMGGGR